MKSRRVLNLGEFGLPDVPMLGRYQYTQAQEGLAPHAHHQMMEICLLMRGKQTYRVGGRDYLLSGGDVFVTFPGETHSSGDAPQEKGVLYWLMLRLPEKDGHPFLGCDETDSLALAQELRSLPGRHFPGKPLLHRSLDEIIDRCDGPEDSLRRIAIRHRVIAFVLRVIACAHRESQQGKNRRIADAITYLRRHFCEPIPVSRLAAQARLSVPRFKALFKNEVGIPPAEFIQRCRIEEAKQLLRDSHRSITDIALDLGYCSSQYFSTTFRRYTRQSPSAYRRDHS